MASRRSFIGTLCLIVASLCGFSADAAAQGIEHNYNVNSTTSATFGAQDGATKALITNPEGPPVTVVVKFADGTEQEVVAGVGTPKKVEGTEDNPIKSVTVTGSSSTQNSKGRVYIE